MERSEVIRQAEQAFGLAPEWLKGMPDGVLQQYWAGLTWVTSDSKLSARDKVLVAFGAAAAGHCEY